VAETVVKTAAETPDMPPPAEGMRLSPLGLIVGFVTGLPRLFFPILAILFGAGRSEKGIIFVPFIIAAVIVGSVFFRWLSWMKFRYFVSTEDIRIESGLLSRNARSIPYERIQDVSIEQKPVARLFSLGEVKFETGSGKGDEGSLSYVSITEAHRLRELVRERRSGVPAEIQAQEAIEPAVLEDQALLEQAGSPPIYAMPVSRVVTLGLYSFSLVIFAVLGGLAQQFDFLLPFDLYDFKAWFGLVEGNAATFDHIGLAARITGAVIALIALIATGFATGIIRTMLREYGFRLDNTAKGFRRRRGLLTLTDTVMPIHRVQAATIGTGPIRKLRGWHSLKFVSLATDGKAKDNEGGDHVIAPLATLAEIHTILQAARIEQAQQTSVFQRGQAAWWCAQFAMGCALIIAISTALFFATNGGWRAALPGILMVIIAPILFFLWRNTLYAIDADQLFVRRGWWREQITIAPQVKIQTVEVSQGPVARLCGLASVQLGLAGGSLEIIALRLETAKAIQAQIIGEIVKVDYSGLGPVAKLT
jgi:putative membrane protein